MITLFSFLLLAVTPAANADFLRAPALAPVAGPVKANPKLTWEAVPRASAYLVRVSPSSNFTGAQAITVYGNSYTPASELPLGTLHWQVATMHGTDQGPWQDVPESFTKVQADAPEQVSPAPAATLNYPADAMVLSWTAVKGMKQYRIELDDEPTFTNPPSTYLTAATSFALPASLPLGVTRYWRVQGISNNESVTSQWSPPRSFSIVWPEAARPTLLTPAASDQPVDDVEFSWSAVAGASRYQIEISNTEDFTVKQVATTVPGTSYRPPVTLGAGPYYWRVRGQQGSGLTATYTQWSAVSNFKRAWLDLQGLPARPTLSLEDANPVSVATVEMEADRIYVSWTPVPRATYYELEISTDSTFTNENLAVKRSCKTPHAHWTPYILGAVTGGSTGDPLCVWTGTENMSASTKFIRPGVTYFVRVKAVDQTTSAQTTRESLWSSAPRPGEPVPAASSFTVVATPGGGTSITEPAVLHPSVDSDGSPLLRWERVAGAEAYMVRLAYDESFTSPATTTDYIVTTNTELVIKDVLPDNTAGGAYYWFVLPCTRWDSATDVDNACPVAAETAQVAGKFASFNKRGKAVAGLSSPAVQTDTTRMSWQDHLSTSPTGGGIKFYKYEVRKSGTLVDSGSTDATGFSPLTKAYEQGSYTWQVRAVDAAGKDLAQSAQGSFEKRTSVPVPHAPEPSPDMPVLTWDATAFAASYDVQIFSGDDPSFPAGSLVAVASVIGRPYPAHVPTAALQKGTYSWRVRQVDAYGNEGDWSSEVLPFTVGGAAPQLQAPLPAAAAPVTGLVFQWTSVPGAVKYRFEAADTESLVPVDHFKDVVGTEYAPEYAFVGGTTYHWHVHALNASGHIIGTSAKSSFLAQTAPGQPQTPTAKVSPGANVIVGWKPPLAPTGGSPVTGYIVRYQRDGDSEWTESTAPADATSLTFGPVEPNTKYHTQVAAENAIGVGRFTTKVSVTTPGLPTAPTELALTPGVRGMTVKWKAPLVPGGGLPVTGYTVGVRPAAGGDTTVTQVTGLTTELTGLLDSTAYVVEVAARNDMGTGAKASQEASTLALPAAPATTIDSGPANDSAVKTTSVSFAFTATPAANVERFECRLGAGDVEGTFETCVSPKQFTGLPENTYAMEVRAVDKWGQVDATPARHVFRVDLTAPDTAVGTAPSSGTTETAATFTYGGMGGDVKQFECRLDAAAFSVCPAEGRSYQGLAPGEHTFAVRAVDHAGNIDATPATHVWTIAAPPVVTPTPTPTPTVTPPPGGGTPPIGTVPTTQDLAAGLARLPGSATSRNGRTFSITLPAGALPADTVVTFKLTGTGLGTAGTARAVLVRAGAGTKVTFKIGSKARKALKKKRKLKLKLTGTATAPGGAKQSRTKSFTLKGRR